MNISIEKNLLYHFPNNPDLFYGSSSTLSFSILYLISENRNSNISSVCVTWSRQFLVSLIIRRIRTPFWLFSFSKVLIEWVFANLQEYIKSSFGWLWSLKVKFVIQSEIDSSTRTENVTFNSNIVNLFQYNQIICTKTDKLYNLDWVNIHSLVTFITLLSKLKVYHKLLKRQA